MAMFPRVRINGTASTHDDHAASPEFRGAQRVAEVNVSHVYPNCPRYIPEMEMVAPSRHLPDEDQEQPVPEWKKLPPIAELL